MLLSSSQSAAGEAFALRFAEAVARTGKLTMTDVVQRAGVGRVTAFKHRRAGILKGERQLVHGRWIWLFEPAEVERYAQVPDLARRVGYSPWRVYIAIQPA